MIFILLPFRVIASNAHFFHLRDDGPDHATLGSIPERPAVPDITDSYGVLMRRMLQLAVNRIFRLTSEG